MRLLGLLAAIPQKIVVLIATHLFCLTLGLYLANDWANERRRVEELQASADRQRQNHEQLIGWYAEKMKELRVAREQQDGADKAAYAILEQGKADAARSAEQARASLRIALGEKQKLEMQADGLKNVNELLAEEARKRPVDPGCIMSPGVRRALDAAAGHPDPAPSGHPEAEAAPSADGADPADSPIACGDLARGYVILAEHDRMLQAWVASWQAWANIALR